jgi:BirA family biotin operon repressor/biotin-[acetyl-CoA-carboxylase] ligase
MLADDQIETLLRQSTRFRRLHHVASCTSTQDLAAVAPRDGDAVFWADHQTRGRGRQQREWHDEPGADLAVTFRVAVALPQPLALPAALPVAVLQAIEPLAGQRLRLKWPNDLFLDGRKLCGVLVDAGVGGPDTYAIGVGVNCNRTRFPPDLEYRATSLARVTGHEIDRGVLLVGIARQLETVLCELAAGRLARLEGLFRERLGLVGRNVVLDAGGRHEGVLQHIDFEHAQVEQQRLPLALVRAMALA